MDLGVFRYNHVRGAVSFTNARNAEEEFSVGLDMPNPPSRTGRAR